MLDSLKRLLPTRESLHNNRWLKWLAPWLHHPQLWHMSRRSIAMGVGVGIFFGFLMPIAQIPFSAAAAILLRANLPVAAASTFVTNPVTFAPVYYGSYRLGKLILLQDEPTQDELDNILQRKIRDHQKADELSLWEQTKKGISRLGKVGKPLAVGLFVVATVSGLVAYYSVHLFWILRVRWARRRRLRKMRNPD